MRIQTHVDLWSRVQSALDRLVDVVLVQIPSHLKVEDAIRRGLNPGVALANAVDDEVASHFAKQVQVRYAVSAPLRFADGFARKVLNHLLDVMSD
eukprot:5937153-Pyramimonas_sp.AAC.1